MLLHVLMEEPSMRPVVERVVKTVCPDVEWTSVEFRGKHDLLKKVEARFRVIAHGPIARRYACWCSSTGTMTTVLN
jgi:hypothetical protein